MGRDARERGGRDGKEKGREDGVRCVSVNATNITVSIFLIAVCIVANMHVPYVYSSILMNSYLNMKYL